MRGEISVTTIQFSPLGQVKVRVEDKFLMLVFSLELPRLVAGVGLEVPIQGQLHPGHQLLVVHGGVEAVVGVPLLGDVDSVVLALVLGLQTASDLASLHGGVASSGELDATGRLGFNLQFDQTEVITLAEDISGLLANISVGRRSHGFDSVLKNHNMSNGFQ